MAGLDLRSASYGWLGLVDTRAVSLWCDNLFLPSILVNLPLDGLRVTPKWVLVVCGHGAHLERPVTCSVRILISSLFPQLPPRDTQCGLPVGRLVGTGEGEIHQKPGLTSGLDGEIFMPVSEVCRDCYTAAITP